MARTTARRAAIAPRIELLEERALLSLASDPLVGPSADPAASLLVRFIDGLPAAREQALLNAAGAHLVRSYPQGPSLLGLDPGTDPASALWRLRSSPAVVYAEPDATVRAADFVPNDPQLFSQWGLSNPNGVDVEAPAAWSVADGTGVVVAVIDTGIDATHPDLAGQIWTNPGEVAGNGRDDDRDGYVDDVQGWNFLNNSADVTDYNGHGTHVSGIVAAAANNGYGVAGVAFGAKIMPLKFMDAFGDGSIDDAVRAVYYAVQHGARVINASWGGNQFSQSLDDAIAYANAHNVVFVTAAGNESVNNDLVRSYPANDRYPNLLSVAAVDSSGNLASFSNYGPTSVDLAAPGVNIRSTVPLAIGGFATYTGTSMSSPFVAGVAALVVGVHPDWTAAQVAHQLVATARPLPSLAGLTVSGGMVDAARALGVAADSSVGTAQSASENLTDDDLQALIMGSDEYVAVHGGTTTGFLQGVYQDALGRDLDPAGLAVWSGKLESGLSRWAVARLILASPEAQQTKVARWFQSDLGRPTPLWQLKTDPTVAQWAGWLAAGLATDSAVRGLILSSGEYRARHGGTTAGFIDGLFQDLLGRPAGADGLLAWGPPLQAGATPYDVARMILASPEAKQTRVARWFSDELARPQPVWVLKTDPGIVAFSQRLGSN